MRHLLRRYRKGGLTAVLAACLLALSACTVGTINPGAGASKAEAVANENGALKGQRIVYIDAAPGNALMEGIAQGLATDLYARGAKVSRVYQTNAQNQLDLAAGNQRINEAIAADVDAIVIFPLDANAVRPGVEAAKKAGIPLFIFQDLASLDVAGKLAFPDAARGKATALALAEQLGGKGKVTVLSGIPTDNIENAVKGALEGFKEGGLTLVGDPNNQRNLKDDAPEAMKIAAAIFQQHPDLDGLLVYNAASATGAEAAAKQAGLTGKLKIATMAGEDANIAQLQSGELAVSYDMDGPSYGVAMGALVDKVLQNPSERNVVEMAPEGLLFTADNVADFKPWSERIQYIDIPSTM